MSPTKPDRSWQIAFWVVTVFTVILGSACAKGYLSLDAKIAYAEETIRKEKNGDIEKIEHKIEKIDEKMDAMKEEQSKQYINILLAIEKLKTSE